MSTFVLNRNYELQLPSSFVDVDCEEMEYVDGGATYSVGSMFGIKCIDIRMNGSETSQFLSDASWAAVVILGAAGIASGPAAGIVAIIIGTYGFVMSRYNSNNSGVTLKIPVYGSSFVQVWDNY